MLARSPPPEAVLQFNSEARTPAQRWSRLQGSWPIAARPVRAVVGTFVPASVGGRCGWPRSTRKTMSRGVISTARPGLIGRLLRIDDWRSIELWADVLVIDRGVWRETVALDKIVDWMIASRLFWSELRLRLDDGRQVSLRGAPRRWAFGGALEGALLGVRRRERHSGVVSIVGRSSERRALPLPSRSPASTRSNRLHGRAGRARRRAGHRLSRGSAAGSGASDRGLSQDQRGGASCNQ